MPSNTSHTDEELYDLFLQGEGWAFQELYARLYSKMIFVAVAILHYDVEDCVAQVFLDLLAKKKVYEKGTAKFKTWLHKVVENAAKDEYRKRQVREAGVTHLDEEMEDDEGETTARHDIIGDPRVKNPREIFIENEKLKIIEEAKKNLKSPWRDIVVAINDDEMAPWEVAEKFKIKDVKKVYELYHYGLKIIRNEVLPKFKPLAEAFKDLKEAKSGRRQIQKKAQEKYSAQARRQGKKKPRDKRPNKKRKDG